MHPNAQPEGKAGGDIPRSYCSHTGPQVWAFLRMGSQYGTEGVLEGSALEVSLISSAVGQKEHSLGVQV